MHQDTDNARVFARAGITPNVRYTSVDSYATFAMVQAGLGVSLNNQLITRGWDTTGIVILPVDPPQYAEIGIAAPAPEELSPGGEAVSRLRPADTAHGSRGRGTWKGASMKVSELLYRRVTREEMTEGLQRVIGRVKAAQSVEEILAARAEYLAHDGVRHGAVAVVHALHD